MSQSVSKLPKSLVSNLPSRLCILLIFAFAVFFSVLAVQQHRTFQTNGLDLGNVVSHTLLKLLLRMRPFGLVRASAASHTT